jgi:peptidoglycan/LPS O-acetylase OafA/YrhL
VSASSQAADRRYLASGDEAGTPPGDRGYRPDVEGLRAVAVLVVVLYHANTPGLTGGYVGVDVFFVISGFVITGLLLRERRSTGRTSIAHFYARRIRRILPAATFVIVTTVAVTYPFLGVITGNNTADDGRWAAVFLSNLHFESIGTSYLSSSRPPSPLQNYWSLSVEEQFYLVYPTLFFLLAWLRVRRWSLEAKLAIALSMVIGLSYWLSISQTHTHPDAAYFSPLTRAWELAIGALIAVGTPLLKKMPTVMGVLITWLGLVAIIFSAFHFNAQTPYPGSLVAIPVVGAALIIAGGVAPRLYAAEIFLSTKPLQWLGKRSYSLYLWHWPILIIAAQAEGRTALPFSDNILLIGFSVVLSMASYSAVENPIRHLRTPVTKTIAMGVVSVLLTITVLTVAIVLESEGPSDRYSITPALTTHALLRQVSAATSISKIPENVVPALANVGNYWGGNYEAPTCQASAAQWTEAICTLGDPTSKRLMVVYGDSHALMWLPAFNNIARIAHWKLVVLAKPYCPAELVTIVNEPGFGPINGPDLACDYWHRWAIDWINSNNPQLLVITQESAYQAPATPSSAPARFSRSEWKTGLTTLLSAVNAGHIRTVILGNIPLLAGVDGPVCLAHHPDNIQACSVPRSSAVLWPNSIEQSVAKAKGVGYVNVVPWFCSSRCTALVGRYCIYLDDVHINALWALYLQNVLADSLGFEQSALGPYTLRPTGY